MNRTRNILLLCLILFSAVSSAQTYERVMRNNLWYGSHNINGIRQDTVSVSYAELSGKYMEGDFRDPSYAPMQWGVEAVTASVLHMEKLSLAGSFSFEQTESYRMCGSMFIQPGSYPMDVLEFTPGRKTLQTYAFDGGISYDMAPGLRIGAKMDFKSSNLAKRKDLRHDNWRLDMTVSPGIMYSEGDIAIGAAFIYVRNTESMNPEQVGTAESSYYAFLDKGLMYGIYAPWTGSGLHIDENGVKGFPVRKEGTGISIQTQYKDFFMEFETTGTDGQAGEKEYIWFLFPESSVDIRAGYRYNSGKAVHFSRLGFKWNGLTLEENILEKITENGVTTVVGHGSNRIMSETGWSISPEYEIVSDKFEIRAKAAAGMKNSLSSQMYPYAAARRVTTYNAEAEALVHIGRFDLRAGIAYAGGRSEEEEWLTEENSGVQETPFRLKDWYDMQMEYMTADRINCGLSLRYNLPKDMYVEAAGEWMHGFGIKYLKSSDRAGAVLKFGYNF